MGVDGFQACLRFGLGVRPADTSTLSDPKAWLRDQVKNPVLPPILASFEMPALPDMVVKAKIKASLLPLSDQDKEDLKKQIREGIKQVYIDQTTTRFQVQSTSVQPFLERLVLFWSNHFTVSIQKPEIAGLANSFESQAIRPHVTGNFFDMLEASTRHPAMLVYLDNAQSFGPDSIAGQKQKKGLNENLAREIMELHTLGVNGGYTQNDVTEFAKVITGWTLDRDTQTPQFNFLDRIHEPGPKTILGKTYQDEGLMEGRRVLYDLAMHPATATHIATKLTRHFISDTPPQSAVDKIAKVFRSTKGDLKAVSLALIDLKECWDAPFTKFKTPYEYVVSTIRLLNLDLEPKKIINVFGILDYRPFNATSPAGYADAQDVWLSSDAILKRIELSQWIANHVPSTIDPLQLAHATLGPYLSADTMMIIKGAPSGKDGLAFLLSSPEFLRR